MNQSKIKLNQIYNMDCRDGLRLIPSKKVDLVVTDEPFALKFHGRPENYNRTKKLVIEGYEEIPKEDYLLFTIEWLIEAKRALKDDGSMYILSGWNSLKEVLTAIDILQLEVINHPIWNTSLEFIQKTSL